MADIEGPDNLSVMFAQELFAGKKDKLYKLLVLPETHWPFFMEYDLFWKEITKFFFTKDVLRNAYNPSMGVMTEDQKQYSSGSRFITYHPGKLEGESFRDYAIRMREILK